MKVTFAGILLFAPGLLSQQCRTCHAAQAASQPGTSMGHALELVAGCTILKDHPLLTFKHGRYSYTITREGDRSVYTVTDGANTLTVPIGWAFGLGTAGQTYVFEIDGTFYESRVSFYNATGALDLTMGAAAAEPKDLKQAAGREMTRKDAVECFACHTTGGVHKFDIDFAELKAGIQCQNCHPQGSRHMEALKAGDAKGGALPHLSDMPAEEAAEFCGRCHRTWEQIAANGPHGTLNVRFQPYRLTNSKCFDSSDKRISCFACHDPHVEIVRQTAHYDPKCQACHHAGAAAPVKVCKVGKRDCAGCHMPKIDLPGAHHQFTDHQIRIVKANQPYPD